MSLLEFADKHTEFCGFLAILISLTLMGSSMFWAEALGRLGKK
jgi:hypothetical protein